MKNNGTVELTVELEANDHEVAVQEDLNYVNELILGERYEALYVVVTNCPEEARKVTRINLHNQKTSSYPLHLLCKRKNVPLDVLQAFLDAAPEAACTADPIFHSLPIHVACRHNLPAPAIQRLINAFPESLTISDMEGNLPIHLACSMSSSDVVRLVSPSHSRTRSHKNQKRQTPLHMACTRDNIDIAMLQHLVQIYPSACKDQDRHGRLPLHVACMWKADTVVLKLLLDVFPGAMRLDDLHKQTPYRILRNRTTDKERIQLFRMYRRANGPYVNRGMDSIQFGAEMVADVFCRRHAALVNKKVELK